MIFIWFNWKIMDFFLHLYGFSFDGTKIRYGDLIQRIVLVMQILLTIHSGMFVILHGTIDSLSAEALFTCINSVMSFVKITTVISNQNEIGNLKMKIEDISSKITYKNRQLFSGELKKYFRITNSFVLTTFMLCMLIYVILPLTSIIYSLMTGKDEPRQFLNSIWFPFDPYEYYVAVRIYNLIIVNITSNCVLSVEAFVMLKFGNLSVLFKSLAEDIVEIVNDHDEKNVKLTEENLIVKIKLHVELIEITKKMAQIYQFALFAHTLCFAGSTCFILLKALVVDTGSDTYSSMATVINMLMYFYYICYFGEKTMEGVRFFCIVFYVKYNNLLIFQAAYLSDRLRVSDYHRLNSKLKKYLLLVILRSQRPQHLRAWKFLKLKLTGFTWFVRLSYSLFTALRHLTKH